MEFNDLANQLFPRWLYLFTMAALIFNFQASNISSIVVSAQTMDSTLLKAARKTCALVVYPPQSPAFECIDKSDSLVPTGAQHVALDPRDLRIPPPPPKMRAHASRLHTHVSNLLPTHPPPQTRPSARSTSCPSATS